MLLPPPSNPCLSSSNPSYEPTQPSYCCRVLQRFLIALFLITGDSTFHMDDLDNSDAAKFIHVLDGIEHYCPCWYI